VALTRISSPIVNLQYSKMYIKWVRVISGKRNKYKINLLKDLEINAMIVGIIKILLKVIFHKFLTKISH